MTKRCPISLQLYSVREEAAHDLRGVLHEVAHMGYVGVELAGDYGLPPTEWRALLDQLGLVASSTHSALPTEANLAELVATARTLGYHYHVTGFGPDQYATEELTRETAATAQRAAELLRGSGLTLGIHNHYWEFDHSFGGRYPHEVFMEAAPDVVAQVDTYWAQVAGADPAAVIRKLGPRAPLLHMKDGPGDKEQAMTAVGAGIVDWPAVIAAADESVEWLIVELDSCDTDMLQAVAESYRYLTTHGFAQGRK